MTSAGRTVGAAAASVLLACGAPGAVRAGGLASPCAVYETRSVVGIVEDLLTDVDDCVRVAAAPAHSPRPVPRPALRAEVPPVFVPRTPLVTAAMGTPILVGRGGGLTPRPDDPPRAILVPVIRPAGGGREPSGSATIRQPGGQDLFPPPPAITVPSVPLPGSGVLLALALLGAAGVRSAHRRRHPPGRAPT